MSTTETVVIPEFKQYRRSGITEMRPYVPGETLSERVSVSAADREAGSPKAGDYIARNVNQPDDQWLVSAKFFASAGFEVVGLKEPTPGAATADNHGDILGI